MGLQRQAAIYKRGLNVRQQVSARYADAACQILRSRRLERLGQAALHLTDEFYALDGGPTVVRLGGGAGVEGGPGIWSGMAIYARAKKMLPC